MHLERKGKSVNIISDNNETIYSSDVFDDKLCSIVKNKLGDVGIQQLLDIEDAITKEVRKSAMDAFTYLLEGEEGTGVYLLEEMVKEVAKKSRKRTLDYLVGIQKRILDEMEED